MNTSKAIWADVHEQNRRKPRGHRIDWVINGKKHITHAILRTINWVSRSIIYSLSIKKAHSLARISMTSVRYLLLLAGKIEFQRFMFLQKGGRRFKIADHAGFESVRTKMFSACSASLLTLSSHLHHHLLPRLLDFFRRVIFSPHARPAGFHSVSRWVLS